ncbi:mRNA decapping enzyme [Sea otter poxvirus]|uniref:mRNA decapping enzyme n=1 Tax=Sea otter poxvirus TaxID=1416741 RepID=A0A2U9QHQ4_9POXV|nr:mRNA decapping enzyme [Sea otter poxvirus]AWU47130.1 mRNA decapping enzyme [Sea otter poxvirus]
MMNKKSIDVGKYLSKHNRKLAKTYIFTDEEQRIYITAFVNQHLYNNKRVSLCVILSTLDGKFLACMRKNTFLFTEILQLGNKNRIKRLLEKYSKFLLPGELEKLEYIYNTRFKCVDSGHAKGNVIFPGGTPKPGESTTICISRELKEETNVDAKHVILDTRFFLHVHIDDLLTGKDFDAILFLGDVDLHSNEILQKFCANEEVASLAFLDPIDKGIACELVRYALSVRQLNCWGTNGNAYVQLT